MNGNLIVAILTTGGVCSVIAAVIGGLFSRRKMSAEATQIITTAAGDLVKDLRDENKGLKDENRELRVELHAVREELNGARRELAETRVELGKARDELAALKRQLDQIQHDTRITRHAIEHPGEHEIGQVED